MTKPKRQQHQTIPPGAKCLFCKHPASVWVEGTPFDSYRCDNHQLRVRVVDMTRLLSWPLVAR